MGRAKAKEIVIQERHIQALELAKKGKSYRVIGAELDISHEQARQDVIKALAELKAIEGDTADELRLLEMARLDAIQAAYWDKAIKGNTGAAYLVVKLSESRRKLAGLDAPIQTENTVEVKDPYADWIKKQREERGLTSAE